MIRLNIKRGVKTNFMTDTILYEALPSYGISTPFIILIIAFIIISIYGIYIFKRNSNDRIINRIGPLVVATALLFVIIITVIISLDSKIKVWNQYSKGNYLVAEGTIENYEEVIGLSKEDVKYDKFSVQETVFHVPGFTTIWGYPLRRIDGGVLKNGMKVKINYIKYKFENVIMKMELAKN